jgi:hypothetical protein
MIKVGDRVTLFHNITREGVVVDLKEVATKNWFIGGVASPKLLAIVKFDDDESIQTFPISKLMRLE